VTRALVVVALLSSLTAHADPQVLRIAAIAPEGTAWARELKAFGRDVNAQSKDALQVKWYWGGIAGDDIVAVDRIRKDQLDGLGSGGMLCERLSPIMRATHMLSESREEAYFVLNRLHKEISDEVKKGGFVYLGGAGLGPDILFTREPVRSMDELRKYKVWTWDSDDVARIIYPALGMQIVGLPVSDAYKAYEDRRTDGFVALPAAALAFQWSAQSRYVSDLRLGFVTGCIVLAQRAFDQIPAEQRENFRAAAAKLQLRFEDLGRQQDEALMSGGLFMKQGLKTVPATAEFRRQYEKAIREARLKLGETLVPKPELEKVSQLLDEYRAQQPR